jgi:hypothetical protein
VTKLEALRKTLVFNLSKCVVVIKFLRHFRHSVGEQGDPALLLWLELVLVPPYQTTL